MELTKVYKFDELSEEAKQQAKKIFAPSNTTFKSLNYLKSGNVFWEDLDKPTAEDLKKELEVRGWATDNLWSAGDVKSLFDANTLQAMTILDKALSDDYIVTEIWEAIRIGADLDGLAEKEDEQS